MRLMLATIIIIETKPVDVCNGSVENYFIQVSVTRVWKGALALNLSHAKLEAQ